ncbi:MAG: FGGY family carbohydrate kinase, partial [Acidimicrobiales bacterium]
MSDSASARRSVTVGIDIGTTSVKAVAVDADGRIVRRTRVAHDVHTPVAGAFEHDVDQAWRADVRAALAAVADGVPVEAVNVSAMVPSLGAVDAGGRALGPGLLYGDHRGERTGIDSSQPGDSGELLAFLAWQVANAPDAAGYWPAQAVANHELCGRGAIDSVTAMTAHPLFDFVGWDAARAA